MANTTNLNLVKPAGTDYALVSVINGNMDIIDSKVGAIPANESAQSQITALNNQLATKTHYMKSGTTGYGVIVRYANVVFFTVFNTTWNSTANTSIISNDANAVQLAVPNGYKPVYNVEIKEAFNNKRITVTSNGDVISNETYSGVSLRFSGCWITSDAMPT